MNLSLCFRSEDFSSSEFLRDFTSSEFSTFCGTVSGLIPEVANIGTCASSGSLIGSTEAMGGSSLSLDLLAVFSAASISNSSFALISGGVVVNCSGIGTCSSY